MVVSQTTRDIIPLIHWKDVQENLRFAIADAKSLVASRREQYRETQSSTHDSYLIQEPSSEARLVEIKTALFGQGPVDQEAGNKSQGKVSLIHIIFHLQQVI